MAAVAARLNRLDALRAEFVQAQTDCLPEGPPGAPCIRVADGIAVMPDELDEFDEPAFQRKWAAQVAVACAQLRKAGSARAHDTAVASRVITDPETGRITIHVDLWVVV